MSDTPWTPGPWTVEYRSVDTLGWWEVAGADGEYICQSMESAANARLIAAAPEMAELLPDASNILSSGVPLALEGKINSLLARIWGETS